MDTCGSRESVIPAQMNKVVKPVKRKELQGKGKVGESRLLATRGPAPFVPPRQPLALPVPSRPGALTSLPHTLSGGELRVWSPGDHRQTPDQIAAEGRAKQLLSTPCLGGCGKKHLLIWKWTKARQGILEILQFYPTILRNRRKETTSVSLFRNYNRSGKFILLVIQVLHFMVGGNPGPRENMELEEELLEPLLGHLQLGHLPGYQLLTADLHGPECSERKGFQKLGSAHSPLQALPSSGKVLPSMCVRPPSVSLPHTLSHKDQSKKYFFDCLDSIGRCFFTTR